jgi:hypothetical protein
MIYLSIHIFPNEIERYKRFISNLKSSLDVLNKTELNNLYLHTTLNLNKTIINQSTITNKIEFDICLMFTNLSNSLGIRNYVNINKSEDFKGVNEHRRITIDNSKSGDAIIFLDSDIYFHKNLLKYQIHFFNFLKNTGKKYFIVSPQTIKLWDNTWNCIVNKKYLNEPFDFRTKIIPDNIVKKNYGKIKLIPIDTFKYGGGWFNCISADLLKLIHIPRTFVGYGPDDTYIMECCKLLSKKAEVTQYIIENMVVCEENQQIASNIQLNEITKSFRANCNKEFKNEINKFAKNNKII